MVTILLPPSFHKDSCISWKSQAQADNVHSMVRICMKNTKLEEYVRGLLNHTKRYLCIGKRIGVPCEISTEWLMVMKQVQKEGWTIVRCLKLRILIRKQQPSAILQRCVGLRVAVKQIQPVVVVVGDVETAIRNMTVQQLSSICS